MFQYVPENVKIQGYKAIPSAMNPSLGLFTTHKGNATGSTYIVLIQNPIIMEYTLMQEG